MILDDFPEVERDTSASLYFTGGPTAKDLESRADPSTPFSGPRVGAIASRPKPNVAVPVPVVDQELERLDGVVEARDSDRGVVTVRLLAADLIVDFPAELFSDPSLARLGQPVHYVVMQRPNGFRYQAFRARPAAENPCLAELHDLLSDI
jgi:hypothetical protein